MAAPIRPVACHTRPPIKRPSPLPPQMMNTTTSTKSSFVFEEIVEAGVFSSMKTLLPDFHTDILYSFPGNTSNIFFQKNPRIF
jgi:hypothetical protein